MALLCILLLMAPRSAYAHEPPRTSKARTVEEIFPGGRAELGMSQAALRQRFGDALTAGRHSLIADASRVPSDTRQAAFYRIVGRSVVAEEEIELFDGHVFRIRLRLAERFEQPILDELVHRLEHRLGAPDWDQTVEVKLGSGRATLRRIGWEHRADSGSEGGGGGGDESTAHTTLELRQLAPSVGGPVYLTLTDQRTIERILATGAALPPQPDRTPAWWTRASRGPRIPDEEVVRELGWELVDLLAAIDP